MASKYPLTGYSFLIIQASVIAVTGKILQGHGSDSYLVHFNTDVPYNRVLQADNKIFNDMNLFEDETQLGDFIKLFHTEQELPGDSGVGLDEESPVDSSNVVGIKSENEGVVDVAPTVA